MVTHLFVRTTQLLLVATLASPLTSCIQPESAGSDPQAPEQEIVLDPAVLPPAINYDLGEATLVQERFPEDSQFRNMPVRLNGLIATPDAMDAPRSGGGNTAIASTALNEPALQFPEGLAMESEILAGNLFTAPIPLTTVRMPLSQFSDVNLKNIQKIALIFDKTTRGSLFVADIELISGQASE